MSQMTSLVEDRTVSVNSSGDDVVTLMKKKIRQLAKNERKTEFRDTNEAAIKVEKVTRDGEVTSVRKVFLLTVGYNVGWVVDTDISWCMVCDADYNWMRYRHHCRACGWLICAACSPYTVIHPCFPEDGGSRVCKNCFGLKSEATLANISYRRSDKNSETNRLRSDEDTKVERDYRRMREIISPNIHNSTFEQVLNDGLPRPLVQRIWDNRILWLICMHRDDLVKVHIGDLRTKFSAHALDIVERRAIWRCLPDWGADQVKAEWKANFKVKLDELIEKERRDNLKPLETRHPAYLTIQDDRFYDPDIPILRQYSNIAFFDKPEILGGGVAEDILTPISRYGVGSRSINITTPIQVINARRRKSISMMHGAQAKDLRSMGGGSPFLRSMGGGSPLLPAAAVASASADDGDSPGVDIIGDLDEDTVDDEDEDSLLDSDDKSSLWGGEDDPDRIKSDDHEHILSHPTNAAVADAGFEDFCDFEDIDTRKAGGEKTDCDVVGDDNDGVDAENAAYDYHGDTEVDRNGKNTTTTAQFRTPRVVNRRRSFDSFMDSPVRTYESRSAMRLRMAPSIGNSGTMIGRPSAAIDGNRKRSNSVDEVERRLAFVECGLDADAANLSVDIDHDGSRLGLPGTALMHSGSYSQQGEGVAVDVMNDSLLERNMDAEIDGWEMPSYTSIMMDSPARSSSGSLSGSRPGSRPGTRPGSPSPEESVEESDPHYHSQSAYENQHSQEPDQAESAVILGDNDDAVVEHNREHSTSSVAGGEAEAAIVVAAAESPEETTRTSTDINIVAEEEGSPINLPPLPSFETLGDAEVFGGIEESNDSDAMTSEQAGTAGADISELLLQSGEEGIEETDNRHDRHHDHHHSLSVPPAAVAADVAVAVAVAPVTSVTTIQASFDSNSDSIIDGPGADPYADVCAALDGMNLDVADGHEDQGFVTPSPTSMFLTTTAAVATAGGLEATQSTVSDTGLKSADTDTADLLNVSRGKGKSSIHHVSGSAAAIGVASEDEDDDDEWPLPSQQLTEGLRSIQSLDMATTQFNLIAMGDAAQARAVISEFGSHITSEEADSLLIQCAESIPTLEQPLGTFELLLETLGANVNAADAHGETALIFALRHYNSTPYAVALGEYLLSVGADILAEDDTGNSPLSLSLQQDIEWLLANFRTTENGEEHLLLSGDVSKIDKYLLTLLLAGRAKEINQLVADNKVDISTDLAVKLLTACSGRFDQITDPVATYELLETLGSKL